MKPLRWLVVAGIGFATLSTMELRSVTGQTAPASRGRVLEFTGRAPRTHDPVIAKEDGKYYLFCTGRGLPIQTSTDMLSWERSGRVFDTAPDWTAATIPGSTEFYWAPDISFFNGKWHIYYSVSTFGSNRSAIGLVTSPTLDAAKPNYAWKDEGIVIESHKSDDWNAIDANVVLDEAGQPWLSWGSFWGGLKLIPLDAETGKPRAGAELTGIAARPRANGEAGAIEAPFIYRHDGYYYLFASFDFCCKGVESTYNIRVGRSKSVSGPYLDRDGVPMTAGGGSTVLAGSGRWRGPGHNAVFQDGDRDWLVYHAYDAENGGAPALRVEELGWDGEGWPVASSAPRQP